MLMEEESGSVALPALRIIGDRMMNGADRGAGKAREYIQ